MIETKLISELPPGDWDATPESVREFVLSILPLAEEGRRSRAITRYQELVDRMFIRSLTPEEQEEWQRLGSELDAENAPFHNQALERAQATVASAHR